MATHDTDALGTDTDSDASEDVGAGETRMIEAKADMTVVKRGQGEREKQCMTSTHHLHGRQQILAVKANKVEVVMIPVERGRDDGCRVVERFEVLKARSWTIVIRHDPQNALLSEVLCVAWP